MKKEIIIKYWFTSDLDVLSSDEKEELELQAKKTIFENIVDNEYTSGELIETINEETFYGWWELKTKTL